MSKISHPLPFGNPEEPELDNGGKAIVAFANVVTAVEAGDVKAMKTAIRQLRELGYGLTLTRAGGHVR